MGDVPTCSTLSPWTTSPGSTNITASAAVVAADAVLAGAVLFGGSISVSPPAAASENSAALNGSWSKLFE